ncbi:MAG: ABC transporter permease [Ruminococcaceae bacterium]|nr:ABC transporter permease [Oscillospiraceae bacterium]
MKMLSFASRNTKEIIRDKLTLFFGIGFPLVILLLLSLINSNIPPEAKMDMFSIEKLAPGVAVFGLSFISLFSGMIIAKDRSSSFMQRLFTSPMKPSDYILGYTLPLIPIAAVQVIVVFAVSIALGLELSVHILSSVAVLMPAAILYIAIGLLCGSLLSDKQVGSVCGALLANLSAWLSGTWFDLSLVGGGLEKAAKCLPFCRAVDAARYALSGEYGKIMPELVWVIGYAAVIMVLAVIIFTKKMKSDNN